jgi:hypothetical protein
MSIKSVLADFGTGGTPTQVFLGGAQAMNLLGEVSAAGGVPGHWEKQLNTFIGCPDGGSFEFAGQTIVKTGYYVKVAGMKFTDTEHGDKGPAYWEMAEAVEKIPTGELCKHLRAVLAVPSTKCDPWVATLTAAMFLSEVVRNPRSFIVNLMLLDLMEGKVKYGSEGKKELDFSKLLKFGGSAGAKSATYTYEGGKVTVGGKGGEAGTVRGGKLPMSQLGAMEQYQKTTATPFEYKKKFDQFAKQSGLNLRAPSDAGAGYHFANALLEKECTVLLRWLVAHFAKTSLKYVAGYETKGTVEKVVWGQKKTEDVRVPIYQALTLTPLREHVRKAEWQDAATAKRDTPASWFVGEVKVAVKARKESTPLML